MSDNKVNQFIRKPGIRIALHLVFWITYLFFSAANVKRFYEDESLLQLMLRFGITLPVDIAASYLTAYYLIPRFLYTRQFFRFAVFFLLSAVGFILIQRVLLYKITYPLVLHTTPNSPFFLMNWFYAFTNIYIVVFVVSGIKMVQRNLREEKTLREISQQRTEAELKFLKAQVHPHFLFNTLNNLYALTLEQSPKAAEVVIRLSDLMNYMLYECNEDRILLRKEIKLIENYLDLERIRYEDSVSISFDQGGETAGKQIAPMLLLPFVENAFKHGVSKLTGKASVHISLNVIADQLVFSVNNTRPVQKQQDLSGYSDGIGLTNVQRRLQLGYPDCHHLIISEEEKEFKVHLTLDLNCHESKMSHH